MTQAYLRGLKKEKLLPKPCSESMLPENLSSETHLIDEEIEEIDI